MKEETFGFEKMEEATASAIKDICITVGERDRPSGIVKFAENADLLLQYTDALSDKIIGSVSGKRQILVPMIYAALEPITAYFKNEVEKDPVFKWSYDVLRVMITSGVGGVSVPADAASTQQKEADDGEADDQ